MVTGSRPGHGADDASPDAAIPAAWATLASEERDAWTGLLRVMAEMTAVLDADGQRRHGLGLGDFDVLMTLHHHGGGLRIARIGEAAMLTRSGASRAVSRLEKRGLVRRRPGRNSRDVAAELTDAGLQVLAAAAPDHVAVLRSHLFDRLPPGGAAALAWVWRALAPPPR